MSGSTPRRGAAALSSRATIRRRRTPAQVEAHLRDEQKISDAIDRDTPPTLPEHSPGASEASGGQPSETPSTVNTGAQHSLVILVQFADQSSLGTTPSQWSSRFFGASDSVRDYYDEVSYHKLQIDPAKESFGTVNDGVVGWLTLDRNHPNGRSGTPEQLATVHDAVVAADPYVNFASYDTDGNGTVTADELHITVIPAGWEKASCEDENWELPGFLRRGARVVHRQPYPGGRRGMGGIPVHPVR